jgi:hypothetical protein
LTNLMTFCRQAPQVYETFGPVSISAKSIFGSRFGATSKSALVKASILIGRLGDCFFNGFSFNETQVNVIDEVRMIFIVVDVPVDREQPEIRVGMGTGAGHAGVAKYPFNTGDGSDIAIKG